MVEQAARLMLHVDDLQSTTRCSFTPQVDVETNAPRSIVALAQCDPSRTAHQKFKFAHANASRAPAPEQSHGSSDGSSNVSLFIVHVASGLCLTVAHNDDSNGAALDLYTCDASKNNTLWLPVDVPAGGYTIRTAMPSGRCMSGCGKTSPGPSPSPPAPPPSTKPISVVIDSSVSAGRFEGLWAMSANGAARQLWE